MGEETLRMRPSHVVVRVSDLAAAVADYRPAHAAVDRKLPRKESLTLELEKTPDLVAECVSRKRAHQRVIAFALEESAKLMERAGEKIARKGVDAIVANPLETMGSAEIHPIVIDAAGHSQELARDTKAGFANRLIEWIESGTG